MKCQRHVMLKAACAADERVGAEVRVCVCVEGILGV